MSIRPILAAPFALALAITSAQAIEIHFPVALDNEGFEGIAADTGTTLVAGQPTEQALRDLANNGYSTVINLRRASEMDDREKVAFDEAALVEALGLTYVNIPLGGDDHPYTPAALSAFEQAMAAAEGKVLLHCRSAWRASQMWAAYLVSSQGFEPAEAVRHAEAINFDSVPMEALLGRELELRFAE